MRDASKTTITGGIPSPQDFRASTTGIGSTLAASRRTGERRAQRVADECDAACAKHLPPSYPPRLAPMPLLPDESAPRVSPRVYDVPVHTRAPRRTTP